MNWVLMLSVTFGVTIIIAIYRGQKPVPFWWLLCYLLCGYIVALFVRGFLIRIFLAGDNEG
jgi:RsiW-degrading membrane proteinase PrsW (M82 family)